MNVTDLCICDVAACTRATSLARAGALMRKYNVGSLPVIDRAERVIGMVTDRDCFLELARRNVPPSEVFVDEVMTDRPAVCTPRDNVLDGLETMARNRVRRLPVVDEEGRLQGIISIDDIVCHAAEQNGREIPYEDVIETLCEITREYQAETGVRGARQELPANGGRDRSEAGRSRREEEPERRSKSARKR